jgi:hypothetical protein
MAAPRALVALATFEAEAEGSQVLVHAGDVLPSTAPVVKGREALFVAEAEYRQTAGVPPTPPPASPPRRPARKRPARR